MNYSEFSELGMPLNEYVMTLAKDIKEERDMANAVNRKLGNLPNGVKVEFYTRIGTGNPAHNRYRRETNKRIFLNQLTPEGDLRSAQFVIYEDGTTKLLNPPEDAHWVEQTLGLKLKNFPIESE